jgi:hypothetical protein
MPMSELATVNTVNISDGRVFVDVTVSPTNSKTSVRFTTPARGMWVVPEVGDTVELTELKDGSEVAHSPRNTPSTPAPDALTEGDVALQLNGDTTLHFNKQSDDTYDLTITCDGDLQLDAANILVGEQGNAQPVATADHTHDFEYDGAGDNSSTQTGTTEQTDSSGTTEADIE